MVEFCFADITHLLIRNIVRHWISLIKIEVGVER